MRLDVALRREIIVGRKKRRRSRCQINLSYSRQQRARAGRKLSACVWRARATQIPYADIPLRNSESLPGNRLPRVRRDIEQSSLIVRPGR